MLRDFTTVRRAIQHLNPSSMGGIIGGEKAKMLEGIDFDKIVELAEQGVLGEIVRVESADGDHITIFVE